MINTVADLLSAFIETEREILNKFDITHAPTIGRMYEGLTSEILKQTIPNAEKLNVVTGFAVGGDGQLSHEQDVMLVSGDGEQIPHTNSYKYPVENILVTIEVKKKLEKNSLIEGIDNLFTSFDLLPTKDLPILASVEHAFQLITGLIPPGIEDVQCLEPLYQHIWHYLMQNRAAPARILLGYNGYKTENGLRKGLEAHIQRMVETKGKFGPRYMPDAILGEGASVVANNASPWTVRASGARWPIAISNGNINPAIVLLETIWSRLSRQGFLHSRVFGEDLEIEVWQKFIDAEFVESGPGWSFHVIDSGAKPSSSDTVDSWEPAFLSKEAFVLANMLCKEEFIVLGEGDFIGEEIDSAVRELEDAGIVGRHSLDKNKIALLTVELSCVITRDGDFVAGENVSGRLVRWMNKRDKLDTSANSNNKIAYIFGDGESIVGMPLELPSDGHGWNTVLGNTKQDFQNSKNAEED